MTEYLLVTSANVKPAGLQEFQNSLNSHASRDAYELCQMVFVSVGDPKSPPRLVAVMSRETSARRT